MQRYCSLNGTESLSNRLTYQKILGGFPRSFGVLSFNHLPGNKGRMTDNGEAYDGLSVFR